MSYLGCTSIVLIKLISPLSNTLKPLFNSSTSVQAQSYFKCQSERAIKVCGMACLLCVPRGDLVSSTLSFLAVTGPQALSSASCGGGGVAQSGGFGDRALVPACHGQMGRLQHISYTAMCRKQGQC